MGLLVGNTTVIEHAGTYVEYSRTYSHVKYAPEKIQIGFVIPKGISLSDGMLLARGLVNAQLGLRVHQPKRVNELALLVFDQPLRDFAREEEAEPIVARQTVKRQWQYDDDFNEYDVGN